MAENTNPAELNLEQILQTLASLPPTSDITQPNPPQQYYSQEFQSRPSATPEFYTPISTPPPQVPQRTQDPRLARRALQGNVQAPPRPQPPQPQSRSFTPAIDPSTITEWKFGLRCVHKIAARNPDFESSIHKLMKDQVRNVRDWENGHRRLIEEQALKRENERTQRAAISLPGLLDHTPILRTRARDQEELALYHQKVYRASRQMTDAHAAELKRLGVPFFGVRPDLLLPDSEDGGKDGDGEGGKVTRRQVRELQRKMLLLLEDLYGE